MPDVAALLERPRRGRVLVPLDRVPLTQGGRIGFHVENALASAAAGWGIDLPLDKIRVQIGDTGQLGYNFLTGGSRSTFSSGMATVEAARELIKEACKRAAKLWELPEDAVEWNGGGVRRRIRNLTLARPRQAICPVERARRRSRRAPKG